MKNSVALLTCEAEFIAISLASQEAMYLRTLLRTMTVLESLKHPITIHCDNQSSIVWGKKNISFIKDRNIAIEFQFIRD